MAEYRLTPAAERDMENVWLYTRQQWSSRQADRYIAKLTNTFTKLARAPLTSPSCDHIRNGYRRRGVGRHMIYFHATDYGVVVVRVLHERMDTQHHI